MTTDEQLQEIIHQGIELGNRHDFKGFRLKQEDDKIILHTTFYTASVEKFAWTGEVTHVKQINPDGSWETVIKDGK